MQSLVFLQLLPTQLSLAVSPSSPQPINHVPVVLEALILAIHADFVGDAIPSRGISSIYMLLTPKSLFPVLTSLLNSRLLYPILYLTSVGFPIVISNLCPKKFPDLFLQNLLLLLFSSVSSNAMFSVPQAPNVGIVFASSVLFHILHTICHQIFSVLPSKHVQNLNTSHHSDHHHIGSSFHHLSPGVCSGPLTDRLASTLAP